MVARTLAVLYLSVTNAVAEQVTSRELSLEAGWSREMQSKKNPVTQVTNLLNKMKSELEAEADKESEMYDQMVCWCEKNEKEKTRAIADADAKEKQLTAEIESRSARFGELSAKIENSKKEIAENTATLKEATAIRETAAAKFRADEKDMTQAITNLRNAIFVLSKHNGGSFAQLDSSVVSGMRVVLRDAALRYELLMAGRSERSGKARVASLLTVDTKTNRAQANGEDTVAAALMSALDTQSASHTDDDLPLKFAVRLVAQAAEAKPRGLSFLQVPGQTNSYDSQSGPIYGIMTQMLEEFEAELATMQKEEATAQADYKALASAKEEEIKVGKEKLDDMQAEDAENAKALSDAKEDLGLTREQRSADIKFLRNLKLTCNDLDDQFAKRSKTRAAETKAVTEALAILRSDDNREMLAKSVSLIQASSATAAMMAKRQSAVEVLRRAADLPAFEADDLLAAWHGRSSARLGAAAGPRTQLSTLAMAVQLDSFKKVKEMMDKMLADLKQEQEEEVAFKAYCVKEMDINEKTTYDKSQQKKALEGQISQLEALIEKLRGEIAQAKKDIAASELAIKKASQTREEENAEFQTIVADQRATQSILKQALTKLKDFYVKNKGKAVLAQKTAQEPPVKFNSYKTNAGSDPVMGLIEQILEDSAALEKESVEGEAKAQADYETFVNDSNDIIKGLSEDIITKTKAVASADNDKAEANEDLTNTKGELESLAAALEDLHEECDFVLKNFDIRQKARTQEMEAISAAKAILSGAGGSR